MPWKFIYDKEISVVAIFTWGKLACFSCNRGGTTNKTVIHVEEFARYSGAGRSFVVITYLTGHFSTGTRAAGEKWIAFLERGNNVCDFVYVFGDKCEWMAELVMSEVVEGGSCDQANEGNGRGMYFSAVSSGCGILDYVPQFVMYAYENGSAHDGICLV